MKVKELITYLESQNPEALVGKKINGSFDYKRLEDSDLIFVDPYTITYFAVC